MGKEGGGGGEKPYIRFDLGDILLDGLEVFLGHEQKLVDELYELVSGLGLELGHHLVHLVEVLAHGVDVGGELLEGH